MGNKRRILLAALAVAALVILAWFILSSNQPPEPVYQGKPLTFWLYEASEEFSGLNHEERQKAEEAVGHFGTNAIPTLLYLLRVKYSPLKTKLIHILNNQSLFKIRLASDYDLKFAAFYGFETLGSNGVSAVPQLVHIFEQNISLDSRRYAIASLGAIGPSAQAAVPSLLEASTNADYEWTVRVAALESTCDIHADPQFAMPVMTVCLTDTNRYIRAWACDVLGGFGTNAKPCFPALVPLLKDPENSVRELAGRALKKIDPESAAKAGVK